MITLLAQNIPLGRLLRVATATVSMLALVIPASARPRLPRYENFDLRNHPSPEAETLRASYRASRAGLAAQQASVRASMADGQARLATRVPSLRTTTNPVTRQVETLDAGLFGSTLTPPSKAKREVIMRGFVETNAALFGLTATQARQLKVSADYANPAGNLQWLELEQVINGIPVFQGTLRAALRMDGALANVTGNLAPGLDYARLPARAKLAPAQAVIAAASSLNMEVDSNALQIESVSTDGRSTTFAAGPFDRSTKAELLYFALEPGVATLAYGMTLWRPVDAFYIIVDAETGALLWRKNITNEQTQAATYSVYDNDSPAPLSPTNATPGSGIQGTAISRSTFTLISEGAAFNDLGWITDGGNTTAGNNVDAGLDIDGVNGVDANGRATGSPNRVFNFTYNPGGTPNAEAPSGAAFRMGAVTNLFFWSNRYHDRLYELGFTEAARNFQNNNFGRGGSGNDRVLAEAQDSSGTDNANFATPPDGSSGRMQMYIFTGPNPDRDGDLDQEIIIHELTHGLSNRLHGNGSGLNSVQAGGMGEGWSDFYARALLSTADEDVNGIYAMGGYSTLNFFGLGTDNYYYGIRRFPYAVRTTVGTNGRPHNPLTFADLDPAQAATPDGAFAKSVVLSNSTASVHNLGEIWCNTLLEVRARLITRLGFAAGNQRALQIVTDAMKLSPITPTFIEARDAIIAADNAGFAGADLADIWAGFAARGMGFGASVNAAGAVVESFTTPNLLLGTVTFTDTGAGANNNGFADPGETITLSIPLINQTGGAANTATATVPGGTTGNYGTINNGATVTRTISYPIPLSTPAGTRLQIPVTINSSLGLVGPVTPTFPLFIGQPVNGFTESFDTVTAPALPAGWTTGTTGAGVAWVTSAVNPQSAPNAAFTPNATATSTAQLTTPNIPINSPAATLTFRNLFNLERDTFNFYDGMVLEISVNNGAFVDVLEAGCTFLAGGYNAGIAFGGPLGGRNGWSGLSGGTAATPAYITTTLLLPASMNGSSVRFRWIVGCDSTLAASGAAGARIDGVTVANSATATPVDGAPGVIPTASPLAYLENQAPTPVDTGLALNDTDSTDFVGATVSVSANFAPGQDVLGFVDQNGITGSFDSGTGVLTLAGTATIANYQAALRSVTYANTSDNPSTQTRTITFTVDDGSAIGSGSRNIAVTAVNDAPTLDVITDPAPIVANSGQQSINLTGIAPGGGETQTLTVTVIGNTNPVLLPANAVSVTYTSPSSTGQLLYTPAAGRVGTSTLTVRAADNGGTANGGVNQTTRTVTITVTNGGNSTPVVTTSTGSQTYLENQSPVTIDDALTLADPDSDIAGATVAITGGFASNQDVLAFSPQSGITGSYHAPSGVLTLSGLASVATYQAALRTVTYHNTSETPSPTARTITITASDGNTLGDGMRSLTIIPVNDAPTFAAGSDIIIGKNSGAYSDTWATMIDAGNGETGQALQFLVSNDRPDIFLIQPAISATGVLTFTPNQNQFGTATVTVQLKDDGGTANNGTDLSGPQTFLIGIASWEDDLGTYTGLLRPATGTPNELDRFGLVQVKFTKGGAFTLKLQAGADQFSSKGAVNLSGQSAFGKKNLTDTATVKRKGRSSLELDFELDTALSTDRLTGTLREAGAPYATFTADRTLYTDKKNPNPPFTNVPAALLGKYTVLFPAKTPAAQGQPASAFPQGSGVGFASVSESGVAKIKGTFADGTKFSHAAPLSKINEWPFHALVDKKKAAVNGPITFRTLAASDLDGANLAWVKLANSKAKTYPSGWPTGILVDCAGSKFLRPSGSRLVPFLPPTDADGNATLTFTAAGLAMPLTLALNIDDKGKDTVFGSAPGFKLAISKKNGGIKGEFTHPATGKKTKFTGALHDRAALGAGYFLNNQESGGVTLAPAP
jgi:hypothetical protein